MRSKFKIILIIILAILAVLIALLSIVGYRVADADPGMNEGIILPNEQPLYHFVMVCKNIKDPFWMSVKVGVEKAAKEFGVGVEFVGPDIENSDLQLKYLDIAIASRVDGIVTYCPDQDKTKLLIDKAVQNGIPVVTIQTDCKKSLRSSFIGENTYNFCFGLGKMLVNATNGVSNAVVIINSTNNDITSQSLMKSGIKDAIEPYKRVNLSIAETNSDIAGSEENIRNIISKYKDIDSIICTNEHDTLLVAQMLVDLNKVGYTVIGYGESQEILRYIEKDVIFGTVTSNPEKMGYDSIKSILELRKNGRTSAYVPGTMQNITKNNVENYLLQDK